MLASVAGESTQNKGPIPTYLEKRADLRNTRPYKKPTGQKDTWEEVGKIKLEVLQIQREIAAEELKTAKRKREQDEEIHQLKIKLMKEEHEVRVRVLQE